MKLWILDIICVIFSVLAGIIFLVRTLMGQYSPDVGYLCTFLECACAVLWSITAYKNYKQKR